MAAYLLVVFAIVVFLMIPTWLRMRREERRARAILEKAIAEGQHEPISIRPYVDPGRCMGSGACVRACPEQDVLQVIDGRARIVLGSHCVGHGACEAACPVDAIELVFGSEKRGIDIPSVDPTFQTNVPGLYVAGELGGMGLIANAVRQGAQAMQSLSAGLGSRSNGHLDVVIVGAGPAGLAAALLAHEKGLTYAIVEQGEFGGSVRHYPRQKLVMTSPLELPGYGTVKLSTARKEELIDLMEDVVAKTGLQVSTNERVEAISRLAEEDRFRVTTNRRELQATRVLLAVGRRGTPRTLGVPGENLEKVAYRLLDPELYQHSHILVVGGGDSALEAACSLAEQPDNRVSLSYRSATITRPKPANLERLARAREEGRITAYLESQVRRIDVDRVVLDHRGEEVVLPNDYVFVFAGGVLPTSFLEKAGIKVMTHFGKRVVEKPNASPR